MRLEQLLSLRGNPMDTCENCGQLKSTKGGKELTEDDWALASTVGLSVPCFVCAECLEDLQELQEE